MANEYDVEFFKKDYNESNAICDGTKCNAITRCVMSSSAVKNESPQIAGQKRNEIIQGLAELTVRVNQEIAELFKKVNENRLPINPPIFKLKLYDCQSKELKKTDYGPG